MKMNNRQSNQLNSSDEYKKKNNMHANKYKSILEKIIEIFFLLCAAVAVFSLLIITVYIFGKGTPAIFKIGLFDFIFGMKWKPNSEIFGIFPMIIGSVYVTGLAILFGVPIGVLTAVFISEISPKWLYKIVRPAVELLAGIPSVVYGFFGLIIFVPRISNYLGGPGNSLLAAGLVLGIMILPTIINISEASISAVPRFYKEGSLAMGASHIQTIFKVILPAARSGVITAIVLGIGRAIGETMAVILVAGNTALIPKSILNPIRTLTGNIALEMGYAFGLHQEALFATGVVLFFFIMLLNILLNIFVRKAGE